MAMPDFDLLIIGGGMVGASLAVALEHSSLRIGLVEAQPLHTDSQPSYDDRGIALGYGSQRIFDSLGLWSDIAPLATPITRIHVSERGRFGVTRLSARQERVPALGQVVTARELGHVLNQRLLRQRHLQLLCPLQVTALQQHADHVDVSLSDGRRLRTALLVAADGRDSTVRQLLGLGSWQRDYAQTAVTANISLDRPHNHIAYERFTDSGPLALLPMSDNRCSLVWTVRSGEEQALLEAGDAPFLAALQQRFGYRAGRFTRVGRRHAHTLALVQTDMPVQPRIVLLGNAAHSLHPIAGQGFNLGLRDVALLADLLLHHAGDCGDMRLLHQYRQWQQSDQDRVVQSTDTLVRLFSSDARLLGHLRGAGLALLDTLPPVKHWLARGSMGLDRRRARLGQERGL